MRRQLAQSRSSRRTASSNYLDLAAEQTLTYLHAFPDYQPPAEYEYDPPPSSHYDPPLPKQASSTQTIGVFELLQAKFGFQNASVQNQKEHFACWITNTELRLREHGDDMRTALASIHDRFFKNYKKWCRFLRTQPLLAMEYDSQYLMEKQLALFLLIWGEAANLRFMPECICFLYHNLAHKLEGLEMLPDVDEGHYLERIVRPLYNVIATMRTAATTTNPKTQKPLDHKDITNYDDLNEFFWTKACLDFDELNIADALQLQERKTFREKRSVFNPLLAFFRIWFFLIVTFHLLVVIAYVAHRTDPNDSHGLAFYRHFFAPAQQDIRSHALYSVFVTVTALLLFKVLLQMWLFGLRIYRDGWLALGVFLRLFWHGTFLGLFVLVNVAPKEPFTLFGASTSALHAIAPWGGGEPGTYLSMGAFLVIVYCIPVVGSSFVRMCCAQGVWNIRLLNALDGTMDQYVGRDMPQSWAFFSQYGLSWFIIFACKGLFCLQLMVRPLIVPTVEIYQLKVQPRPASSANDGLIESNHNLMFIAALWAPVFLVYMYDSQIWFTLYQAIVGMAMGMRMKIGHYAGIVQFRKALYAAPEQFDRTVASTQAKSQFLSISGPQAFAMHESIRLRFAIIWNEIVSSFRLNDLLDDRETVILQYRILGKGEKVEDPIFLLAGKLPKAIEIIAKTRANGWNMATLVRKLADANVLDGVQNGLELVRGIFHLLLAADRKEDPALEVLDHIFKCPDVTTVMDFTQLPVLADQIVELLATILDLPEDLSVIEGIQADTQEVRMQFHDQVMDLIERVNTISKTVADMFYNEPQLARGLRQCLFTKSTPDLMYQKQRLLELYRADALADTSILTDHRRDGNGSFGSNADRYTGEDFITSCTRLFFLLRLDVANSLPRCEEARRRMGFFLHSLSMKMPTVSSLRAMPSFSVMTPYYSETVLFTLDELKNPVHSNPLFEAVDERAVEKGRTELSIMRYLITFHAEEWGNFLERMGVNCLDEALEHVPMQVRLWASLRGQTLARTVHGMMMYDDALRLLRWLEVCNSPDLDADGKAAEMNRISALKFSYITGCQIYGQQSAKGDHRAADIDYLMKKFPSWRVSFVDQTTVDNVTRFDCVLAKAEGDEIVEVYRYELPGNPILGEGKPENQNVALPFTRGEYVQTIDMNQEHYFEETLKMPNFLATATAYGEDVTIIGMKEHVFTGRASSLARFMTMQELVFVTLTQRVLAHPLRTRMHYGHPDVFEKSFVMTNGGVSKASKGINLSEDVFSGYNVTLRGGVVTHQEFMQCGKGRDVTLSQINAFEAKLSNGCAESCLSREGHRLGNNLDFFRLNSMFYGHFGFYICNAMTVFCVYVYAYAKLYIATHEEVEKAAVIKSKGIDSLSDVINTQYVLQFGFLTILPLLATLVVEFGFKQALFKTIELIATLGIVFYTFLTGTKAHYFDVALLRGGSKYRGTGRGFSITRDPMVNFFKEYGVSHFRKALELIGIMILVGMYGNFKIGLTAKEEYCNQPDVNCDTDAIPASILALDTYGRKGQDFGKTTFAVFLLAACWLLAPFVFNTDGLVFQKSRLDVCNWFTWMMRIKTNEDELMEEHQKNVQTATPKDGWLDWWQSDVDLMANLGFMGRLTYAIRESRHLLAMYYVFTTQFTTAELPILIGGTIGMWALLVIGSVVSYKMYGQVSDPQSLMLRGILYMLLVVGGLLAGPLCIGLIVGWNAFKALTLSIAILVGLNGICQYGLVFHGVFGLPVAMWTPFVSLGFLFDMVLGLFLVVPLLALSFLPFMRILQTRMMYNGGFSRALSSGSEVAASLCILLGLVCGYIHGFLTCFVSSLSYVNDPADNFIDRSFLWYIGHALSASDANLIRELLANGYLKVIGAGAAVVAVFLSMLLGRVVGRRVNLLIGCICIAVGIGLNFTASAVALILATSLIAAGCSCLCLNYMLYSFEICTRGWRGKSILMFLMGTMVGYTFEAILIKNVSVDTMEDNWSNEPLNKWRLYPLYAVSPALVVFMVMLAPIPESPIWLLRRKQTAAAKVVLIRLRQRQNVDGELEFLSSELAQPTSNVNLGFRACMVFLLQCMQAMLQSNVLFVGVPVQVDNGHSGQAASWWRIYFGIMVGAGVGISTFLIDNVRRKTILKDFMPFLALLTLLCGILASVDLGRHKLVEGLMLLAFAVSGLSLAGVTWVSALEMFPLALRPFFFSMSVAFYYVVHGVLYLLTPSFAAAQYFFASLCILLTVVLFTLCASTKQGAIQLKSEKRLQKEREQEMLTVSAVRDEATRRHERDQQHKMVKAAASQMSRRGFNPSNGSSSHPSSSGLYQSSTSANLGASANRRPPSNRMLMTNYNIQYDDEDHAEHPMMAFVDSMSSYSRPAYYQNQPLPRSLSFLHSQSYPDADVQAETTSVRL